MPRLLPFLLTLTVFFKANPSFAQTNLRFTHYTTREGLSNNIISYVFQDSRGLLWVGTSNGLNYFDGVTFQNIYPTDFDSAHLHSDQIKQIAEIADGNILLMTDDGMEEYNWKAKTLQLIFPASMNGHIFQFIIDKQKNIWLLSEKYLQKYNREFLLLKNIRLDTLKNRIGKNGGFNAQFFTVDNANNIWLSYHDIVCEWNTSDNILESRYNNVYHKKIFRLNPAAIEQDKKGNYWIIISKFTPPNALARYQWNSDTLDAYYSKSNLVYPIIISHSGKIWLNSYYNGLVVFDTMHHTFQTVYSNPVDINSPSGNVFLQMLEDKSRNIWLATRYGLDKCTDLTNSFTVLDNFGYEDPQTNYNKAAVSNITAVGKNLFVCTTGGFFKINTGNFSRQCFRYNKKGYSLKDNYWISFNIDNKLLLASTSKGIWRYNLNDEKLQPALISFKHPALLDSVATVAAFQDVKKNTWLSLFGGNGIYCWDRKSNVFIKYDAQQTEKNYFPLRHFSCAAEDDYGNIWMGYDKGGLTIFDNASQKFVQPAFAAFRLLNNTVISNILNDRCGNLWITTSKGLYCYSLKTKQLKQYNRTDGLISNIVMGIAMDKNGVLWMGTSSGLSRFDTTTKQFTNFTAADGLPEEETIQVIYDSASNKICFTTEHTVVLFNPHELNKIQTALSPVITAFNVMGKQRSLDDSNKITLSANEKYFSFNYTAPDFINSNDVQYEYKLEGFNENWINAGRQQYAGYTNLDGGDYIFKVRAGTDGVRWYEISTPVSIHINTPFLKTLWFYLLTCAVVITIIFLFMYSGYRAKLKRVITALKIRNEIASDLHDDVGSSLSSIMLMSEIAKQTHDNTQTYFDRIKQNAGKIIENMNDIVWAVNPNNDTIEQLFIRMQTFAVSLLEKKDIEFKLSADDALRFVKLSMEERKNFYLIFKEAIHNAFKYSGCKNVTAHINCRHKNILMNIQDDGKGFDASQTYMGNGLNNMKKRAKEIGGQLDTISYADKGTTITLIFKPTHKGS
ncbi:MAG TPA: two-component regulator propeller domain-containing protein [Parafilimonas sp.]|nr:two-component regulator propeller domain-containing protein [Parafilimonas sp.]